MNHLTELQCSMYVDGALNADEQLRVSGHIEECEICAGKTEVWRNERNLIQAAVTSPADVAIPATMPRFSKRMGLREFVMANLATGGLIWVVQFVWKTLFGELAIELLFTALSRVSIPVPDGFDVLVETGLLFISEEGDNMISNYFTLITIAVVAIAVLWIALSVRRARLNLVVFTAATLAFASMAPDDAMALETRTKGALITIEAGEVIDDTVIAAGETIRVDGTVNGDLFAFSRRVVVNGDVSGNLVAFAESITVRGEVGGMLLGGSSSLEIDSASVGGDLWGASNSLLVSSDTNVSGNTIGFAETIVFSGSTGRDLATFSEVVDISGQVGEDVEAFSGSLNLLGNARIGGDVRFRGEEEDLQRSDTAMVEGIIEFPKLSREFRPRSRYLHGDYYIHRMVRLAAAFLAGLLLMWLVPAARDVELDGGVGGLKTAGIGLVSLVSLPIISVLFAMTLVGLPIAVIGFFLWITLIYFAKIVVAFMVGRMILSSRERAENFALTLFVGLVAVILVVSLPGLGFFVNVLLTIIGFGMLISLLLNYSANLGR